MKHNNKAIKFLDDFYQKFEYKYDAPYRIKTLTQLKSDGYGHCADVSYNASLLAQEHFDLPFNFAYWNLKQKDASIGHIAYVLQLEEGVRLYSHSSVQGLSLQKTFNTIEDIFTHAKGAFANSVFDLQYGFPIEAKHLVIPGDTSFVNLNAAIKNARMFAMIKNIDNIS